MREVKGVLLLYLCALGGFHLFPVLQVVRLSSGPLQVVRRGY